MESIEIRLATADDLGAIEAIYDHYVHHSTCTYQLESDPQGAREAWFSRHGERHPVVVATLDGDVVGWGSLSIYNPRAGYAHTVESSVYVHPGLHKRGIGRALMLDLIARAEALGHHTLIAGVDGEQTASLALHESLGFSRVAHLKEVGFKFGRWLDVIYLQRMVRK